VKKKNNTKKKRVTISTDKKGEGPKQKLNKNEDKEKPKGKDKQFESDSKNKKQHVNKEQQVEKEQKQLTQRQKKEKELQEKENQQKEKELEQKKKREQERKEKDKKKREDRAERQLTRTEKLKQLQKEKQMLEKERKKQERQKERERKHLEQEQKKLEREQRKLEKQKALEEKKLKEQDNDNTNKKQAKNEKPSKALPSKKRKREPVEGEESEPKGKRQRILEKKPKTAAKLSKSGSNVTIVRSGKKNQSILRPTSNEKKEGMSKRDIVEYTESQDVSASQSKRVQQRQAKKCVVTFTGFRESDPKYNFKLRQYLAEQVKKLGGEVSIKGGSFDSKITHVVAPPMVRTMKTLIGSLTGRWFVKPEWIINSIPSGKFIPAGGYGHKLKEQPFKDKKVFISDAFIKENANKHFHLENFQTLIEKLGRGSIVTSAFGADIILVGTGPHNYTQGTCLTWNEFFSPHPATGR